MADILRASAEFDLSGLARAQAAFQQTGRSIQQSMSGVEGQLSRINGVIGAVGDVAKALTVADFARGSAQLALNFEKTFLSMRAYTGGLDNAKKTMETIRKIAADTKQPFLSTLEGAVQLLPMLKTTKAGLTDVFGLAQRLAALDPFQGFRGAAFSMREFLTGDVRSLALRFELPLAKLREIKEKSGGDVTKLLGGLDKLLDSMGVTSDMIKMIGEEGLNSFEMLTDQINQLRINAFAPLLKDAVLPFMKALNDILGLVKNNPILTSIMTGGMAMGFTAVAAQAASRFLPGRMGTGVGGMLMNVSGLNALQNIPLFRGKTARQEVQEIRQPYDWGFMDRGAARGPTSFFDEGMGIASQTTFGGRLRNLAGGGLRGGLGMLGRLGRGIGGAFSSGLAFSLPGIMAMGLGGKIGMGLAEAGNIGGISDRAKAAGKTVEQLLGDDLKKAIFSLVAGLLKLGGEFQKFGERVAEVVRGLFDVVRQVFEFVGSLKERIENFVASGFKDFRTNKEKQVDEQMVAARKQFGETRAQMVAESSGKDVAQTALKRLQAARDRGETLSEKDLAELGLSSKAFMTDTVQENLEIKGIATKQSELQRKRDEARASYGEKIDAFMKSGDLIAAGKIMVDGAQATADYTRQIEELEKKRLSLIKQIETKETAYFKNYDKTHPANIDKDSALQFRTRAELEREALRAYYQKNGTNAELLAGQIGQVQTAGGRIGATTQREKERAFAAMDQALLAQDQLYGKKNLPTDWSVRDRQIDDAVKNTLTNLFEQMFPEEAAKTGGAAAKAAAEVEVLSDEEKLKIAKFQEGEEQTWANILKQQAADRTALLEAQAKERELYDDNERKAIQAEEAAQVKMDADFDKRKKKMRADFDKQWLKSDAAFEEARKEQRAAFEESEIERRNQFNESMEKADEEHRKRLAEAAQALDAIAVRRELEGYGEQKQNAQEQFDAQTEDRKKALADAEKDQLESYKRQKKEAKDALEERIREMEDEYAVQKQERTDAFLEELNQRREQFKIQQEEQEQQFTYAQADVRNQYQRERQERLRAFYEKLKDEADAQSELGKLHTAEQQRLINKWKNTYDVIIGYMQTQLASFGMKAPISQTTQTFIQQQTTNTAPSQTLPRNAAKISSFPIGENYTSGGLAELHEGELVAKRAVADVIRSVGGQDVAAAILRQPPKSATVAASPSVRIDNISIAVGDLGQYSREEIKELTREALSETYGELSARLYPNG